jgi:dipeptidyl aminopeptidase/acylaminoacyl peptidase
VIEVESGNIQEVDYEKLPIVRNSFGFFYSGLGWWAKDSQRAYFVDMKRDYQSICVVEFDIHTGNTFILFEETSETYINTSLNTDDLPTFLSLPESNELIWFSERTDWAHCYLYDLDTGKLKNSITQGEWVVRDILYYDELRRELFLSISGRVPDRDPYYRELVRVNIDSKELTVLSSGNHDVLTVPGLHPDQHLQMAKGLYSELIYSGVSYTGNFAVVTCSRADTSPISVLLNRDGDEILTLEVADLSPLYAKVSEAWRWPEPVKLLAADKKTDTYGLVYRPSDFSPEKSYPVLSHVFNTPELSWVPKGSFTNGGSVCGAAYFTAAALAELGFIVVQIDGRGTAFRSKAFQDESYGWAASASHLEDHVAGIEQLAECYPYMDTNRVGIYALHGGPGIQALLDFPEFYKVSVCALVHDSRLMPYLWGDKFEGLPTPASNPEGTQNKTFQYPEEYMDKLQGKVLLVHGMLDISCPPAITFRLVEALQKANKDFDLLLLPCSGHSNNSYVVRRAWDYLVKNLLEIEPPKEFELTTFYDM